MSNSNEDGLIFLSQAQNKSELDNYLAEFAQASDSYDISSGSMSNRRFLDIESNISVRNPYSRDDYYSFRSNERPPKHDKDIIRVCMKAYENVGLIKNVIDLMSDFAVQGVRADHVNERTQRFYRRWFEKVRGPERSERFLNILFRCANVVVERTDSKLTDKQRKKIAKGDLDSDKIKNLTIPSRYEFLNPLNVEIKEGKLANFVGKKTYCVKISKTIKSQLKRSPELLSKLPKEVQNAVSKNSDLVELNPNSIRTFFYKKDDWQLWAHPMIFSIIDDVTTLEKMKLADMSALDGAISNVRLWRVGVLDGPNSILPKRGTLNKLRDIIASHTGGGTIDLVWGPELDFKESQSEVYKYLGAEKYEPHLNSIYGGLGIPQSLTGSGSDSGFTNNFVSLKTLIERLEYGRSLLIEFWNEEFRRVQTAMGFQKPAKIGFDHIILSDESAEKNLLIQLADRNIISDEALIERFGENPPIERSRVNREEKLRQSEKLPKKTSPYHDPYIEKRFSSDEFDPQGRPEDGRPKDSKDTKKRKQRIVNPRTKAVDLSILLWANSVQDQLSKILSDSILKTFGRKNLRALTREEAAEFERVKFKVLCCLEPHEEISHNKVGEISARKSNVYKRATKIYNDLSSEIPRTMNLDELRQTKSLAYLIAKVG